MARTSDTHPLQIAEVMAGPGMIGVSFCPGRVQRDAASGAWARDLGKDVEAIRAWGAAHVLTLIEPHEFGQLQVQALPDAVRAAGMHWHHLPIRDVAVPDHRFATGWPRVAPMLAAELARGGRVFVHCKGGLGRAGTVAAWLLRHLEPGVDADAAIARVRAARKGAVETAEQAAWIAAAAPVLPSVDPAAIARARERAFGFEADFRATRYRIEVAQDAAIDLRIGEANPALAEAIARAGAASAVMITAHDPFSTPMPAPWNAAANARLQAVLQALGHPLLPAINLPDAGDHAPEPGFFAFGIEREASANLCAAFAQNAVVFVAADGVPELLWNPLLAPTRSLAQG